MIYFAERHTRVVLRRSQNFNRKTLLAGEKKIVKLLHFPNITPTEQRRLLMSGSDSGSGSDDEQEKIATVDGQGQHKAPRKKSSTKRSLDMQRKISLSKLREEKKEKEVNNHHNNSQSPESSTTPSSSPSINSHSLPLKQKTHRSGARNGKVSDGYDQYLKQYLLQVPMPKDYGEPSSDDLSSEWDSDVPDNKAESETANKESKVSFKRAKQISQLEFSL